MKILINLILFNPKTSLSIAKDFISRLTTELPIDIFIHAHDELLIGKKAKKSFVYPNGFDFKGALKNSLITLNKLEIEEYNQYDIIFTIADSNYKSFIRLLDTPPQRIKYMMKGILRSPKRIIVPLRFSEPFSSIDSLNDKIFISNVQIFRILTSMALRNDAHAAVSFGFLAHRLGIPVSGVED